MGASQNGPSGPAQPLLLLTDSERERERERDEGGEGNLIFELLPPNLQIGLMTRLFADFKICIINAQAASGKLKCIRNNTEDREG